MVNRAARSGNAAFCPPSDHVLSGPGRSNQVSQPVASTLSYCTVLSAPLPVLLQQAAEVGKQELRRLAVE